MKYNEYTQTYDVCFGDLSKKRQNRILEQRLSKAKENYDFLYDCLEEIKTNMEHVNKILELLTIFKDKDNTQTIIELEKITDTLYTAINYATKEKNFLQDREDIKKLDKETLDLLDNINIDTILRRIETLNNLEKELNKEMEEKNFNITAHLKKKKEIEETKETKETKKEENL